MSKGDKRRPGKNYADNFDAIFTAPMECPFCGEIEMTKQTDRFPLAMWECQNCQQELQI